MPGMPSQRPFLPSQLMNPMYGSATFPWGSQLPNNPNPLAKAQPVHTNRADLGGIQSALQKRAANLNLGKVPQGSGPQQMFNAMSMLGQARALVDPEKTLQQEGLARGDFEGMIDRLAKKDGERYDFQAEKQDPKRQAIIKGLLGALAGGGVGYLGGGGGVGSTLAGAAVGGVGGAGIGALGAKSHNRKLHSTAKVLKNYGLLQPEYLRAALPLLKQGAQDNAAQRLSATGENSGVSFKHDDEGHLTGADAFKTLDSYMKKAGFNSFQRQFFGRLIQQGMDETMIRASVKTACDRFGDKVAKDLNEGMEKIAFGGLLRAGGALARRFAPKMFGQGARQAAGQGARRTLGETVKQTAQKVTNPAFRQGLRGGAKPTNLKSTMYPRGQFGHGILSASDDAANQLARNSYRMGRQLRAMPGRAGQAMLGRNLPGGARQALGQMGTGALTGALNPYTGLGSGNVIDDQGNFHLSNLLQSMAGGAALGRVPGMQRAMQRGMVGEGFGYAGGYGANALGHLTGNETLQNVDPRLMAQLGFGAGAASSIPGVPGARSANVTKAMQRYEPFHAATRATGRGLMNAGRFAKANPGTAAAVAGGLGTPAAAMYGLNQINDTAQQAQQDIQNQMHGYMEHYDPQIQEVLSEGRQAAQNANQAAQQANNLLGGGGEGGGGVGNIVSNLMGGVGNYFKENPMMMLALLGGLGGLGGYGMGGAGGATMGGIGLPLLYLMASGQLGNMFGGQGQGDTGQDAAATQAQRQKALEDAQVAHQVQGGNVAQLQQPRQNELARQQQQQAMSSAMA